MNQGRGRGRGRSSGGYSGLRGRATGAGDDSDRRRNSVGSSRRPSINETSSPREEYSQGFRNFTPQNPVSSGSRQSRNKPSTGFVYVPRNPDPQKIVSNQADKLPTSGVDINDISTSLSPSTPMDPNLNDIMVRKVGPEDSTGLTLDVTNKLKIKCPDEVGSPTKKELMTPFNICLPKTSAPFMLKVSLFDSNREKRNQLKRSTEGVNGTVLRSGMVLLKNYLSINDQVKIVKSCQNLGSGPGGFYQPGYSDGSTMHLKMMCLGKNWEPESGRYGVSRQVDGAKPPMLPRDFHLFVEKAIKDSHALINANSKATKAETELPSMSPNICIVNFYSASGKLGLHQDKDESEDSLRKGLPVISFSIGDSAEFLYSDQRDAELADKVMLESGDVLLFGGKSRHIFHGVKSVLPNSAPKSLKDETNLRPGRLNLTFREF